jgi:hypothetical protein
MMTPLERKDRLAFHRRILARPAASAVTIKTRTRWGNFKPVMLQRAGYHWDGRA